eukprot:m.36172 g.36172  ORF g.36172 m.36172 type:complete len:97 (-) comp7541_c0_seq1:6-296(-)
MGFNFDFARSTSSVGMHNALTFRHDRAQAYRDPPERRIELAQDEIMKQKIHFNERGVALTMPSTPSLAISHSEYRSHFALARPHQHFCQHQVLGQT